MRGHTELDERGEKKRSWTAQGGPQRKHWQEHLSGGKIGLGIGASTETNQCYFGVIDYDNHDGSEVNHAALAAIVEAAGVPLVVCRSKSGGAHLFLFLRDPAAAKLVRTKLRTWADALGIGRVKVLQKKTGNLVEQPVEIFPKADVVANDSEGNWINLPYYGNGTTNRYAVAADGTHLTLDQFLDLAERSAVSAVALEGLEAESGNPFKDGPPCLQAIHLQGIPEGTRNNAMYNIGIAFKLEFPDDWQDELADYNVSGVLEPPLSEKELTSIIRSLEKRDYAYKCAELPIEPHCDKRQCKKQKYGIDAFRKLFQAQKMPELRDLRRITTDPPRWILNVAGQDLALTTEDLMLVPRFRKAVLEKCGRIFPLMRQGDWDDYLSQLLDQCEVIEAPEDAGVEGQFEYLFREFLLRRRNAQSKEDLLAGLPWEDGAKVFFRAFDLMAFLERKKFRDYTVNMAFAVLKRKYLVGHTKSNINGRTTQLWFVQKPKDEQTEEFSPKVTKEPEF